MVYDLLIIGGGPAGMTTGLYGARGGLKTVLVERGAPGGQAATTDIIENYPGFPEGISGAELSQRFFDQAVRFGLETRWGTVDAVALDQEVKSVSVDGEELKARAVVVATGAEPRSLGVPGEETFRGRGVSYCATCDGAFFRDKKVAVVGGGDAAVEEALFLTKFAIEVVLIHRRDQLRAAWVVQERARNNSRLSFRLNTVVKAIEGDKKVDALLLQDKSTGEESREAFDGVFVFIGTAPSTAFLGGALNTNDQGYITTDISLQSSIPGVFAAGDVRDKHLRQVSTAVGDGALAAMAAERLLANTPF